MSSRKGILLFCSLFMANGIYMGSRGIAAMRTGALVHSLSPTRVYEGYEVVFFGALSMLAGMAGVWAVLR